jgi:hypothetical protein
MALPADELAEVERLLRGLSANCNRWLAEIAMGNFDLAMLEKVRGYLGETRVALLGFVPAIESDDEEG